MYWKAVYATLMVSKISFKFYAEAGYDVFEYLGNTVQVNDNELLLNGVISNIEEIISNIKEAEYIESTRRSNIQGI